MRCWYSACKTTGCGEAVLFGFQSPIACSRSAVVRISVWARGAGSLGIGALTLGGAAAAPPATSSTQRSGNGEAVAGLKPEELDPNNGPLAGTPRRRDRK